MYKLMLADDEKATRDGILHGINWSKLGIAAPFTAVNGLDALEQTKLAVPDILLTDVKMPKMNGIELAKRIRSLHPECSVLIISGFSEKQILRSAIQLRAVNFVDKPVELPQLEEQLRLAVAEQERLSEREYLLRKELAFLLSRQETDTLRIEALQTKLYPIEMFTYCRPFAARIFKNGTELTRSAVLICMESVIRALKVHGGKFAATTDEDSILLFMFNDIEPREIYTAVQSCLMGYTIFMSAAIETKPEKSAENSNHVKAVLHRRLSEHALAPDGQLIIVQGAPSSPIEKALQIIHKEYADKSLSISEISRRLFTSGAYFCVLFKTHTGTTFVNYLTDYRISKALEIMRNQNIQIQEIAELAGFESGNYFSKVFKKKMGMPPAEYRKQFIK